jgi:phage terminase large subunit-like protein
MKRHIPGIIAFKPGSSSKYNRAMSIQHYVAAGNIWVPADTMYPWVDEWMDEITNFPVGSYDDQVDSFVQGVSYLAAHPMMSSLKSEATWGRQAIGQVPDRYRLPGVTGR